MAEYTVEIQNKIYEVKVDSQEELKKPENTSEDIVFSAVLAEYEYCARRSEKLDNKVYILLTVCAFLFVLLTNVINEAEQFKFSSNIMDLIPIIVYMVFLVGDVGIYLVALVELVRLLKSIPFKRFDTRKFFDRNMVEETPDKAVAAIGIDYVQCIENNNKLWEQRYKKFNFCIHLLVANAFLSILLEFICVFISLHQGI